MNIKITVRNKIPICGNISIVCNNSDYVVVWELGEEWNAYDTKTMRTAFPDGTYTDTVFTGNTVALPVVTVPGRVKIGLYAGDIRTSRPALILALDSITSDGGTPADPPEDVYNQLMERMAQLETPDWAQNDPDAKDYVKNRTHWVDDDGTVHQINERYLPSSTLLLNTADTIPVLKSVAGDDVTKVVKEALGIRNAFVITAEMDDDGNITADKTYDEIRAATNDMSYQSFYVQLFDKLLSLDSTGTSEVGFSGTSPLQVGTELLAKCYYDRLTVYDDDTWSLQFSPMSLPIIPPNPDVYCPLEDVVLGYDHKNKMWTTMYGMRPVATIIYSFTGSGFTCNYTASQIQKLRLTHTFMADTCVASVNMYAGNMRVSWLDGTRLRYMDVDDSGKLISPPVSINIPAVNADDNGKVMKVVDGEWAAGEDWIISSSTPGSTKKFKLTVNDSGTISATGDGVDNRFATEEYAAEKGIGMNIVGATVGQIAVVSAVDDNGVPTAWEMMDVVDGELADAVIRTLADQA